mgnify:CR=1 FL=1|tara:strand:+ start:3606 stop:4277 length:672 start_codon:yes stop_codon:yes gene_type:complete
MKWITESAKRSRRLKDKYSMRGTDIYIQDPVGKHINLNFVFDYIMARVPNKLLESVDVIYVGDFPDFKRRDINAYYDSGAIFVTNNQDDDKDMIDDIVHEIAHGVEERYNDFIYSDNTLEKEFFAKRQVIYRTMKSHELDPPKIMITDTSYNEELDSYFYEEVGYEIMNDLVNGIFVSAYAATSLNEYFARGFEEYVFGERKYLSKNCPALFRLLEELFEEEK